MGGVAFTKVVDRFEMLYEGVWQHHAGEVVFERIAHSDRALQRVVEERL